MDFGRDKMVVTHISGFEIDLNEIYSMRLIQNRFIRFKISVHFEMKIWEFNYFWGGLGNSLNYFLGDLAN